MSALTSQPPVDGSPTMSTPDQSPIFDLTSYVDPQTLVDLDNYLITKGILSFEESTSNEGEVGIFSAESQKHGDAIELRDRDTSTWCCSDAFCSYSSSDDFRQCRAHRGDAKTWRPNKNAHLLPGVTEFVVSLPFFSSTGKVAIIVNKPNDVGVEHADHALDDLVSEFVWIRTASSKKRFYVKDQTPNETRHFVGVEGGGATVGWFDDHFLHNIVPVDDPAQWSIRVDGKFTPKFRELLSSKGVFGKQVVAQEEDLGEGLAGVLRAAEAEGPVFLQRENEYVEPVYSDTEEEDEEDEGNGEHVVQ